MENIQSSLFADAFWAQYVALLQKSVDNILNDSPVLAQAAAILVLANVLDNRQKKTESPTN